MTVPVEMLLELIPTLQPRAFSIASSQHAHPTQVHLCVAVVEYTTPYNRQKQVCIATLSMQSPSAVMLIVLAFHNQGVCSSWLSALVPGKSVIPLWWVLYEDTCPPRRAYYHLCVCLCVSGVAAPLHVKDQTWNHFHASSRSADGIGWHRYGGASRIRQARVRACSRGCDAVSRSVRQALVWRH